MQIILANFRAAEEAGLSEEETAAVTAEQNDSANSGDIMKRSTAEYIPLKPQNITCIGSAARQTPVVTDTLGLLSG